MVSVAHFIRAAAVVMVSTSAFAADMPMPPPMYQPMVVEQPTGAWYLRGFVGVGMSTSADFVFQPNPLNAPVPIVAQHSSFGDTTFIGGGIGYEVNNWLRFDVTAEYRAKTPFNAFIIYSTGGGGTAGDQYNAFVQSDIFLANAYIDLGTWNCLTPFIGFGVGGAVNTFDNLTDTGIATSGNGIGTNATEVNFAWAGHAGLAYNVTQNLSLEFAYRYLNYGSVSDKIICQNSCNPDTYQLKNLTSQDFMLGMRWRFPVESSVVVSQPAPLYTPPPAPLPPPLSTRG